LNHSYPFLPFHAFRIIAQASTVKLINFISCDPSIEKKCCMYFKELYAKLAMEPSNKVKGEFLISSSDFLDFYDYPGIIGERFRKLMDPLDTGYIDAYTFSTVMTQLSVGTIQDKIKFVFQMMDFDSDGSISKEDIKTMLLHIPLAEKAIKKGIRSSLSEPILLNFDQSEEILSRVKSQQHIANFLKLYFKSDYISFKQFEICTHTKASDIFINIFYILVNQFPSLTEVYMTSKDTTNYKIIKDVIDLPISNFLKHSLPYIEISNTSVDYCSDETNEENIEEKEDCKINSLKTNNFNSNNIQVKNNKSSQPISKPKINQLKQMLKKKSSSMSSFKDMVLPPPNCVKLYEKQSSKSENILSENIANQIDLVNYKSTLSQYTKNDHMIEGHHSEVDGKDIRESYYLLHNKLLYSNRMM
jgi:Ca2+-binding EF-hand superfamily protein